MFKKITSNRDPQDTIFTEVKKEFLPYYHKAGTFFKSATERYPVFLFWMMVINITLSVIFVTLRHQPHQPKKAFAKVRPVDEGIDQLIAVSHRLKITINLKRQVDSLMHKNHLTASDSVALLKDLDSLQHLQIHLNPKR